MEITPFKIVLSIPKIVDVKNSIQSKSTRKIYYEIDLLRQRNIQGEA